MVYPVVLGGRGGQDPLGPMAIHRLFNAPPVLSTGLRKILCWDSYIVVLEYLVGSAFVAGVGWGDEVV